MYGMDFDLSAGPTGFDSQPSHVASKLSLLPLIVPSVGIVASIAVAALWRTGAGPVVGWILTPFVVVGCLAWARFLVLSKSRDPWFDRADGRRKLRILQVLMMLAFVVSLAHVWRIGQEAALWLQ